jgi:hypothetical protein
MQKRSSDHLNQQGSLCTHCMLHTLNHVRCRLTTIPFFRVCTKHLNKDDKKKIHKNEYLNDRRRIAISHSARW